MWIVKVALNRPYTFIVVALLILLASPVMILRTPTDIFPTLLLDSGVLCSWLSEKRNSFLRLLKNKGFKKESMTKVGLYTISTSTTLESNKSLIPKTGGLSLLHGASTSFAFPSASTTCSALALDDLWLAFMASNHIRFVTLHLIG